VPDTNNAEPALSNHVAQKGSGTLFAVAQVMKEALFKCETCHDENNCHPIEDLALSPSGVAVCAECWDSQHEDDMPEWNDLPDYATKFRTVPGLQNDLVSRLCEFQGRMYRSRYNTDPRPHRIEVTLQDASLILEAAHSLARLSRVNETEDDVLVT